MLGFPEPEDASFYVQKISASYAGLREHAGHWKIRKLRAGQDGAENGGGGGLTLLVLNKKGRLCITRNYASLRPLLTLLVVITSLVTLSMPKTPRPLEHTSFTRDGSSPGSESGASFQSLFINK